MEGNLVRLSVEVDEPEFDKALGDVVRTLAQQVRVRSEHAVHGAEHGPAHHGVAVHGHRVAIHL